MPVPKKRTTSTSEAANVESSDHTMPDAQEFRQRLRNLAVSAIRVVIEEVMRAEFEQCLGAAWGELTPERKGYRNGTYTRNLATSSGPTQDLEVPRDREGNFHTQVFDRYNRYEAQGSGRIDGDVCRRSKYSKGGSSGPNAYGCCSQCEHG